MANKLYKVDETTIVFGSEVGDDVAWTTESVGTGTGWQSELHDQGVGSTARAQRWMYRFYCQAVATPTLGLGCQLYLKTSDGTHADNDDGTSDIAVTAIDKLSNLTFLKSAICDQAAANIEFVCKGRILIPERHFGVVLWNALGSDLTSDVSEIKAEFTPIPDEIQ